MHRKLVGFVGCVLFGPDSTDLIYYNFKLLFAENLQQSNEEGENMYFSWANNANLEKIKKKTGDQPNSFFYPDVAKKLFDDCKELPMWSCVLRDHFGNGHVRASS